jgi:hypothetical protein
MPARPDADPSLTPAIHLILLALLAGDRHGYAIMQAVETLTDGQTRLGPGTLYSSIKKMIAAGLIEEERRAPRPAARRRAPPLLPDHGRGPPRGRRRDRPPRSPGALLARLRAGGLRCRPDIRAIRPGCLSPNAANGLGLYLFPNHFRTEYGECMRQAFRDRCREIARGERSAFKVFALELARTSSALWERTNASRTRRCLPAPDHRAYAVAAWR